MEDDISSDQAQNSGFRGEGTPGSVHFFSVVISPHMVADI